MSTSEAVWVVGALLAVGWSVAVILPTSRDLISTLRDLCEAARRAEPTRFAADIEPKSPFAGGGFKHHRIGAMLKADFAPFGEHCQTLQQRARSLDRRAHLGLLPTFVFVLGVVLWYVRG